MPSAFHVLPTAALGSLAEALRSGRLRPPVTAAALARVGLGHLPGAAFEEMRALLAEGLTPEAVAWGLERLAGERELQGASRRVELVWTGPEVPGAGGRDTSVVVREIVSSAERSILLATYAVFQGAQVFEGLTDRMAAVPGLSVRMFINVPRPPGSQASEEQLVRAFGERFLADDWPRGARAPELFYDPRALDPAPGAKAVLHAKCLVVDDARAFVSSANFTEAAQLRNIEAGVLVENPAFARALRDQFEGLVGAGLLRRVPWPPR